MLLNSCLSSVIILSMFIFFFNDTATTEIYTLSLHDALPIFGAILISGVLVAIIPLSTSMVYLLVVITLIGITSGFFGQSIAWAAEQIEEKVKRIGKTNFRVALGVQSHVTRGIRSEERRVGKECRSRWS